MLSAIAEGIFLLRVVPYATLVKGKAISLT